MTPDLDYKALFFDAIQTMTEFARAAGFDPNDENVDPPAVVARIENLRTERGALLADADASQHWQTRALRAEAALEETRAALRLATEPKPDDLLGVRLVNGCASLPNDTPAWVADLFREAWAAIRVLRADAASKATRIAGLDEEIEDAYQMLREGFLAGPLVTGRTEEGLRVRDRLLGWVFTSFAAELERSDAPNNLSISMTPNEDHTYANYRLDLCIARPGCPSAHEQNVALRADVERLTAARQAAEAKAARLAEDLEDARRMYREDTGYDDTSEEPADPCDVCGVRGCDDTCGAPDCVHGLLSSGDDCPSCRGRGASSADKETP